MSFSICDAASPIFVRGLTNLSAFLDKAVSEGFDETVLMPARLYAGMRPLSAQIQLASAKGAVAGSPASTTIHGRHRSGLRRAEGPHRPHRRLHRRRRSRGGLRRRGDPPGDGEDAEPRTGFDGAGYLTSFALPNFHFHVATAYGILRKEGVPLGKLDYLGRLALV